MLTLTCCQDHILTENVWFVCSETLYCGDERRCHGCGTNKQTTNKQLKIELLSQWKLEAESRNKNPNSNKQQRQIDDDDIEIKGLYLQRSMLAAGRSRLLLFLLLFLPQNSQADDGCPWVFGTSRSIYWRCGDVCTRAGVDCICGGETVSQNDGMWCCGTNCNEAVCLKWKQNRITDKPRQSLTRLPAAALAAPAYCLEWSPATCTNGVALPLNESCNGVCNYHPGDKGRNYFSSRSHVAACTNSSTCVKEGKGVTDATFYDVGSGILTYRATICTGNSSCEGELAWCKKDERKNETCPYEFSRCSSTLGGSQKKDESGIPGQCIEDTKVEDGSINHCLDRTDENPFKEGRNNKNQLKIDLTRLESCVDDDGRAGLECSVKESSNCKAWFAWCFIWKEECPLLGKDIFINNAPVCQDYKFWQDKPCNEGYMRCKAGQSGQCVKKEHWGNEEAQDGWGNENEGSCKDGSDLFRPIIVKEEETGIQPSQPDKKQQSGDFKVEENSIPLLWFRASKPQVWNSEPISEEYWDALLAYDWSGEEWQNEKMAKYKKDLSTGLMMIPVTEKTCKANDGFVCKVSFFSRLLLILL